MKQVARRELLEAIAEQLCVDPTQICDSTRFADLRADSLDMVELGMMIEEKFELDIQQQDAVGLKTFGDAVRFVEQRLGYSPWIEAE